MLFTAVVFVTLYQGLLLRDVQPALLAAHHGALEWGGVAPCGLTSLVQQGEDQAVEQPEDYGEGDQANQVHRLYI